MIAGTPLAATTGRGSPMQSMNCPCSEMMQMSGPGMWILGGLAVVLLLAAIAALVSLSVYLIRRSHAPPMPLP